MSARSPKMASKTTPITDRTPTQMPALKMPLANSQPVSIKDMEEASAIGNAVE